MTSAEYSFGPIQEGASVILYFKQGDVEHRKDITDVPLPEDDQERFTLLHTMIYEEGWVPNNNAVLVQP